MKKYILGLDEGTTSARAVIFDAQTNKIVSSYANKINQIYPHNGWVEQDANQIVDALYDAIEHALCDAKISAKDLCGVGITNQRESIVAWDYQTGQPIYNSICWQCRRTAQDIEKLSDKDKKLIKQKTGLVANAYFSASKMAWILKNVPKAQKLCSLGRLKMGTIDSYLAWKLTGKFVTDTTNASRTMLFDIYTQKWDDKLLSIWNIDKNCLPEVVASDHVVGPCKNFENAPLCAIIGDQQSSLVGQDCLFGGDCKATFGTGAFILINLGEKAVQNKNLLTTIAYTINGKTCYALEGSIYSASSGINWLKNIGLIDSPAQTAKMAESLSDNGGVYFVPAFNGLGAPYWNDQSKAVLCGLNLASRKEHIIRAMLESMAYNTFDIIQAAKVSPSVIKVDGGASENTFMLQFLANLSQTKVCKTNRESTVLGAIKIVQSHFGKPFINTIEKVFVPSCKFSQMKKYYDGWKNAVSKTIDK